LIALDVLLSGDKNREPSVWAGGSCGNVMTILSYFGWSSYPIAMLGRDPPSKLILTDMKKWGVHTDFLQISRENDTPIVLERLTNNNRFSQHNFEFRCPYCGASFPRNKQMPEAFARQTESRLPKAQVFYYDRASRATLQLAKFLRSSGALIVFEPYRDGRERLFRECLNAAHIVKYSHEQVETRLFLKHALLEIQTLGAEGLRYRTKRSNGNWKTMPAFKPANTIDSAGAGDWCTAGLLHAVAQNGLPGFSTASAGQIDEALAFAQGLAALCCQYEGPRGLMYVLQKSRLKTSIKKLVDGSEPIWKTPLSSSPRTRSGFRYICSSCQGNGKPVNMA
jgi:fructokinase